MRIVLSGVMNGFDTALFDLINREWASPFLDHFLPVFSSFDAWKPIMIEDGNGQGCDE